MKVYAIEIDGTTRLFTINSVSFKNSSVEIVDVERGNHIVITTEAFKRNTTKTYDFDEIPNSIINAVREEERKRYTEAVENYNTLCGYLNGKDESVPIVAALAIIQDFLEQKERELAWE